MNFEQVLHCEFFILHSQSFNNKNLNALLLILNKELE